MMLVRLSDLYSRLFCAVLTGILISVQSDSHADTNSQYLSSKPPKRIALVVGNSDYQHLPVIPSARIDAQVVSTALKALSFSVHTHENVKDYRQFELDILPNFRREISEGDFVLVYFSGHGFSHGPHNMLAYTDQPLTLQASRVAIDALSVEALEDLIAKQDPGLLLFILDACRNVGSFVIKQRNGSRSLKKGLNTPSQFSGNATNTLTGFATRPGATAEGSTADGQLSTFTEALLNHIPSRDSSFSKLFDHIAADVLASTDGEQHPGLHDYSSTDPFLDPPENIIAQELEAWKSALANGRRHAVRMFLSLNSVGHYANAARKWLSNHPNENRVSRFTRVSPAAVERAWSRSLVGSDVAVTRLESPIAFERTVSARSASSLASFTLSDVGVIEAQAIRVAFAQPAAHAVPFAEGPAIAAHGTLIATEGLVARSAPSMTAGRIAVEPGTRLVIEQYSRGNWISRGGTTVFPTENSRITWLKATSPSGNKVFLPISKNRFRPARLGQAILEISVPPRKNAIGSLVEADPISKAVAKLRKDNKTITWVSLSIASAQDSEVYALRQARLHNAEFILKNTGIAANRITALNGATDYSGEGVRLRFFGY